MPKAVGSRPVRAGGLALALLLAAAAPVLAGRALPITPDGKLGDWRGTAAAVSDPGGDGAAGGLDLARLFLANDAETLYLRLEVGRETILQNPIAGDLGNHLRLYLDLDGSAASGLPIEGLGVELEIRFGERQIVRYDAGGAGTGVRAAPLGIEYLPTHSAAVFEIRFPFRAAPTPAIADRLAGGGELALFFEEATTGGDRLPDAGALTYAVSTDPVKKTKAIKTGRKKPAHVRLLTLNANRDTITVRQEAYRRLLRAVDPDLIAFQEITAWDAARTRDFVAQALPLDDGRRWQADQVADAVTVSSYPLLAGAAVDANLVVHVDLPDERTPHDLVLFNVHTPCCNNELARDEEHDRLMATWRNLLEGQGPFGVDPRDAVVLAGDFNMVGFRRQLDVLQHGRFIDPAHGPDFAPGRGKGSLRFAKLRHSHRRLVHTWRRDGSEFAPGRLDYVFFSSDVAKLKRNYVLDTATMPQALLDDLGLEREDSADASDHLPLVTDFAFRK